MKRLYPILLACILLFTCLSVSAMGEEKVVGEVLYHQDFSHISQIENSSIRLGTASAANSTINCAQEHLQIRTYDGGRAYVLLPQVEREEGSSYTVEFSFHFESIHADNGYLAAILTCRGEEPTNITAVTIRADGTVDDFSPLSEEVKKAIGAGEKIEVKIPLSSGVLHELILTAPDGSTCTVEREDVMVISPGSMGFAVRNTDVNIDEVYLVNGTEYTEKTGYYAEESYEKDETAEEYPNQGGEYAPSTWDNSTLLIAVAVVALLGILGVALLGRKRK